MEEISTGFVITAVSTCVFLGYAIGSIYDGYKLKKMKDAMKEREMTFQGKDLETGLRTEYTLDDVFNLKK